MRTSKVLHELAFATLLHRSPGDAVPFCCEMGAIRINARQNGAATGGPRISCEGISPPAIAMDYRAFYARGLFKYSTGTPISG